MRRFLILLPALVFIALALVFYKGLSGDPSALPSSLIEKPAPDFSLEGIAGSNIAGLKTSDLAAGKVSVVNIWASWCGPCRAEHPQLMELAKRQDIFLYGINNKDNAENAVAFLNTLGQPFRAIGADINGRVTIDWGGYGVPESFIIDGTGKIRYKHIGPLSPNDLADKFNAEIEKAKLPLTGG